MKLHSIGCLLALLAVKASAGVTFVSETVTATVYGHAEVFGGERNEYNTPVSSLGNFASFSGSHSGAATVKVGNDWYAESHASVIYAAAFGANGYNVSGSMQTSGGTPTQGVPVWAETLAHSEISSSVSFTLDTTTLLNIDMNSSGLWYMNFELYKAGILVASSNVETWPGFTASLSAGDYSIKLLGGVYSYADGYWTASGSYDLDVSFATPAAHVPDAGSTIAFLAIGLVGIAGVSRLRKPVDALEI